jgi:uncharacterized protein
MAGRLGGSDRISWIGLISDTHGLLRPEAVRALEGAELIIHAGDVGKPEVLEALRQIAPVVAVRGNVDHGAWADALPETATVEPGIFVLHDAKSLRIPAGVRAVVSGHSHQASVEERGGVLYVNPGAAGPRRFLLPVTVARLWVAEWQVEIVELAF